VVPELEVPDNRDRNLGNRLKNNGYQGPASGNQSEKGSSQGTQTLELYQREGNQDPDPALYRSKTTIINQRRRLPAKPPSFLKRSDKIFGYTRD